ncbi:MAG: hypothetical protein ABW046_04360 [Actinoplanes sp.]
MTITMRSLLNADVARVRALAGQWRRLADSIDQTVEDLARRTGDLPHHWRSGPGAEAAAAKRAELPTKVGNAYVFCNNIAVALGLYADEVEDFRARLIALIAEAEAAGLRVDPDTGSLTVPAELTAVGQTYLQRFSALIELADGTDFQLGSSLSRMTFAEGQVPTAEPPVYRESDVLQLASSAPDLQAGYWHDLHPVLQERAITEHPDIVAGAVGLPAREREAAARILRRRERESLLAGRAHLEDRLDGAANRALTQTNTRLADLDKT